MPHHLIERKSVIVARDSGHVVPYKVLTLLREVARAGPSSCRCARVRACRVHALPLQRGVGIGKLDRVASTHRHEGLHDLEDLFAGASPLAVEKLASLVL